MAIICLILPLTWCAGVGGDDDLPPLEAAERAKCERKEDGASFELLTFF